MSRTYAVTGVASGIGLATRQLLESSGHRVIGIDLRGAEIDADLSSVEDRSRLRERVAALSGGPLDAVIAVAGVLSPTSLAIRVNYFGALATLTELHPLLLGSGAPRACIVASFSALQPNDASLVAAMDAGDEVAAVRIADSMVAAGRGGLIYASTKRAVAEWVRRASIENKWAGAGIPLNAVGPGIVVTPMTAEILKDASAREAMEGRVPMPLGGPSGPEPVAALLAWLASEQNSLVTGQVIFADGGADASTRGARIFDARESE